MKRGLYFDGILSKSKPRKSKNHLMKFFGFIFFEIFCGSMIAVLPWYFSLYLGFIALLSICLLIKLEWALFFLVPGQILMGNISGFRLERFSIQDAIPLYAPIIILSAIYLLFRKLTIKPNHHKVSANKFTIPSMLLVCYAYSSVFRGQNIDDTLLAGSLLLLNLAAMCTVIYLLHEEKVYHQLMWFVNHLGMISVVLVLFVLYTRISVNDFFSLMPGIEFVYKLNFLDPKGTGVYRANISLAANQVGSIFNMITAITIGLFLNEKNSSKKLYLSLTIALFIICTFMTRSKAAAYSLVPMLIFFIVFFREFRKHAIRNFILMIVGLTLLFAIMLQLSPESRKGIRINPAGQSAETGLSFRLDAWKAGFAKLKQKNSCIVGLGTGGYQNLVTYPSHAHNTYLGIYFDYGIVGLAFIAFILIVLTSDFLKIFRHQETYLQKMSLAVGGGLFATGLTCLVGQRYTSGYIWLFIALGYATFSLARQELVLQQESLENSADSVLSDLHTDV